MEETLTPQERKALIESIKNSAIERRALYHYGLTEKEAQTFGVFEEATLTTEESDDLFKKFIEESCKDPAVFRSSGGES